MVVLNASIRVFNLFVKSLKLQFVYVYVFYSYQNAETIRQI